MKDITFVELKIWMWCWSLGMECWYSFTAACLDEKPWIGRFDKSKVRITLMRDKVKKTDPFYLEAVENAKNGMISWQGAGVSEYVQAQCSYNISKLVKIAKRK